jgi:predicted small lipoprotein YifL
MQSQERLRLVADGLSESVSVRQGFLRQQVQHAKLQSLKDSTMKSINSIVLASTLITLGGCGPAGQVGFPETDTINDPISDASAVSETSACTYNVTKGSPTTWLLTAPEMHFVFWGTWSDTLINIYQKNWTTLLNGGTVLQRLDQYGIGSGTLDSRYYTITPTDPLLFNPELPDGGIAGPNLWSDYGIVPELNREILAGNIPAPNDNTLYMIMLPAGIDTYNMLTYDEAGYHGWATYNGQKYTYGVIGYRGTTATQINAQDEIISHELAESATDPDTTTGWRDYSLNQEIADICVWQPTIVDGLTVQKYFIQTLCICQ